ncbi:MAG: Ig-like domain-containing protein [Betaproteobacteria bacterium]
MNKFENVSRSLTWFTGLLLSALVAGCGGGSEGRDPILGGGGIAVVIPTVTAVAPINNATGVPVNNTLITAAFAQDMAPATINTSSFTLACPAGTPVTGTVAYVTASRVATFTPAVNLPASTLCTATITTGALDTGGNPLASNYVWTFTTGIATDTTRPRVTLTIPATTSPGPTGGVPTNTAISAAFSEDMAPASITPASFTVTCPAPCVAPIGILSYAVGTRTAVFAPAALLVAGATYTVTVTTAATDLAGNALAGNQAALPAASNYVWTFTTAGPVAPANVSVLSTNPTANATGVCPNATINATFNVANGLRMDPVSITTATFSAKGPAPASTPVTAASVMLDAATGRIASLTPVTPLTSGVTYTATIKGGANGVKDLAVPANVMAADFTWTFTAGPATGNCLIPPGQAPIALGSASTFGAFGGSAGTTNQGLLTVINGDIGTTAVSTAVTGFHDAGPGCIYTETPLNVGTVNGKIYTAAPPPTVACPSEGTATTFAIATQARADALAAYNALVALPGGPDPGAGNLGNLTLAPGVYTASSGSFMIQGGNLTLDAQGNVNAVWVFQMATSLTVGGPGAAFPQSIILTNGASAKNVFWQVGSAATINAGGGGTMVGTIISQAGAAFSTAGNVAIVTLNGRALSLGASVTMVNTVVNVPAP